MLLIVHNQSSDGHPKRWVLSYLHQHEAWKHRVVEALKPLEQPQPIAAWHDRKLLPGQEWDEEIWHVLKECHPRAVKRPACGVQSKLSLSPIASKTFSR